MAKIKISCHAVVRIDHYDEYDVDPALRTKVVKILFDPDEARSEVARLRRLNGKKGCVYFWSPTHIECASSEELFDRVQA